MWGFGLSQRSASELLDGTLKLRHCTSIFLFFFPLGLYQGLVMGVKERHLFTPVQLLDDGSKFDGRVRLTRKTRPVARVSHDPDPGIQRRGDGKDCALLPPWEWGGGGCASQSFSSTWGWVRFTLGDARNLPSEGTGVVGYWLVSRRGWCTGTSPV